MIDGGQSRRRLRERSAAAIGALVMVVVATGARGEHLRLDPRANPRIVNGLETHDYPTTGALLYSQGGPITADNAGAWCSGTLIGCQTFLVAAHCVSDDPIPSHYLVYLQNVGLISVASISRHPSYVEADFPRFDAAVIKLANWVTGVAPTAINQTDPTAFIGAAGTIVGFGQTQGFANDYGLKRVGAVQISACPPDLADSDVLCWEFSSPVGPLGTDSNTCNGDSGGPLFLDLGGGTVVGGITSGGNAANCLPDDTGYDADVFVHRSYILGELGTDSTAACGGLAPVGSPQTTVVAEDGTLDGGTPTASHTVSVPAGANALRVALNGEDDGLFDVNLYVKNGPGAGPSSFDCAATGTSVFGSCSIDLPAAGTWSIAVERVSGAGKYQLTSTIFGGPAPTCGNNTREFNESCDGADAALCPGLCTPTCACAEVCTQDDLTDVKARITAERVRVRSRVQSFGNGFASADPRNGLTLTLVQGGSTVTIDIPAGDPGWASSRPDRGRYKWTGFIDGVTRIKAVDRTAKKGSWSIIVIGDTVPGAGGINTALPVQATLTIDGACTESTF